MTRIKAGPYTVRGVSVGGIYTSLHVPELDSVFDAGVALRSAAGAKRMFLSHGHVDHSGALAAFLGIRMLVGRRDPLPVYMPSEIVDVIVDVIAAYARTQRYDLAFEPIGLRPGDVVTLRPDLRVVAFKTYHPVPSLGYRFVSRRHKLKAEFRELPGPDIARMRAAGDAIFDVVDRVELAYATDTLSDVFNHEPELAAARVLIAECTFLDQRKSLATTRASCHIHLDELIEHAESISAEVVVLMHFSQMYSPGEVRAILARRLPPQLAARVVPFVPMTSWFG